ncbi:MAG: sigma-70 family RNA polymerase sigma factor [Planctomycetales bacterium]
MIQTDDELISACRTGNTEAFGELVCRYQDRLFHGLLRMLGSREDAQDIAQEAFVQAFQKLSSFRGDSAFYSWLFRIAWNSAVSQRRRRKTTTSLESVREQAGVEATDRHPQARPEHPLELTERRQLVRRALDSLSEEYRTVLVLKEMEEMSYEEIAQILNCPIGTVRSRIHRGREELRERLKIWLEREE